MSKLWADCLIAGPLASLPVDQQFVGLVHRFRRFFRMFPCFREILRHQNASIEFFDDFQQTWDECIDFLYHNPSWRHGNTEPQPTLLHRTACYVYNNSDLAVLERRLELQLHIMNAKINDILLNIFSIILSQSDRQWNPDLMITGSSLHYGPGLPPTNTPVDQDTWTLFNHLVELQEVLKRLGAPALGATQREQIWQLVIARFREHELLPSQDFQSVFSTDFTSQDMSRLREYSRQSLKMRQSIYRAESLIPTLRRRVYSCSGSTGEAIFQFGLNYEEERLQTIDVVTREGSRWIVSTKQEIQLGFVQHLPSINKIHPYTRHPQFNVPHIRLYELCSIDETNGAQTKHHQGMKPLYRFDSSSDEDAFQCALRGKILQHTFRVKEIKSAPGFGGSPQPLKLWSDFEGEHQSLSFLQQYKKPYCHIDIPLRTLAPFIYADDSSNRVRVDFSARRPRRSRRSLDGIIRLVQQIPIFSNRSAISQSDSSSVISEQSTAVEDELTPYDVRFLASLRHLKIEFSSSGDAKSFQEILSEFFTSRTFSRPHPHSPFPPIIPAPSSSGDSEPTSLPEPPLIELPGSLPEPHPVHELEPPPDASPNILPSPSSLSETENRHPTIPIQLQRESTVVNKDLDYRVRGIRLEQTNDDLMSFLKRKLDLEDAVVGRIKSLAVSHTGESKVAVVSLKPRPICLSTPGKEEWIFGPESGDDDDTHITVDTHFRGVTVFYAPSQGTPHTIDICAVAGLGGHAWGSFKHKAGTQSSYMWVLDALPKAFPSARIMAYGSKTKLDGNESTQTLEELGMLLRSEMRTVRKRRALSVVSLISPLLEPNLIVPSIFIAHSLGGLTVKEALLQEIEHPELGSFLNTLHGALFFGVPSHGMKINGLRAIIRGQPNEALIDSLSYQSETLKRLTRRFNAHFENGGPRIIYFYEKEPSFTPKLSNGQWRMEGTPKKFLVDEDSATNGKCWAPDPVDIHPLNRDHSGLVKFSSPDDGDLERVLAELRDLLQSANMDN